MPSRHGLLFSSMCTSPKLKPANYWWVTPSNVLWAASKDSQLELWGLDWNLFLTTVFLISFSGFETPIPAPNLDDAPDLRRALSLLSTESWSSMRPGHSNLAHFVNTSHNSAAHPAMQAVNTTSAYCEDQQTLPQQEMAVPFDLHTNTSQYQGFPLPKSSYEMSFFDSGPILSKSDGRFLEFKTWGQPLN